MNMYIPEPRDEEEAAAQRWWRALDPGIRMVFLQALWETEGCETPEQLEPHQRNPRYVEARVEPGLYQVGRE